MVEANASSIPVLTDVLVPGNPALARPPAAGPAQAGEPAAAAIRAGEGHDADRRDEATATEPAAVVAAAAAAAPAARDAALAPADEMRAGARGAVVRVARARSARGRTADSLPGGRDVCGRTARRASGAGSHAARGAAVVGARARAGRAVVRRGPRSAADRRAAEEPHDPLSDGEGRGLIEARCRDALHDHAGWLVGQIAREVALALETEVAGWVTEEVGAALARRNAPARSDTTQ